MTEEQINAAIAEACGWKVNTASFGTPPMPTAFSRLHGYDELPNYCNDLNAMHEAEKTLTQDQSEIFYPMRLGGLISRTGPIYATARQRAEAFLRTLDKWEDSK